MTVMSPALVAALNILTASAYMFISSPSPIPGSAPKAPLDASGSNFPCHGITLPSSGGINMPAGSSQLLAWNTGDGANTAVHGGGSCQMSITYETDAAKVKDPKSWFVIYSIEGGCPSNTLENLDGEYTGLQGSYSGALDCTDPKTNGVDCANRFNFTIPEGVKNGHAIMAWTWYNNVGDRELYMNCINAQLSGGDGSEMEKFPTMFIANIARINSCPTTEGVNVEFPFPGKYVTTRTSVKGATSAYPLAKPTGQGCANDGAPVGGSGSNVLSSPSSSNWDFSATTTAYSTSDKTSITMFQTTPTAQSQPSKAPLLPTVDGTGSSYRSCGFGKVSCLNPGKIICIGKDEFGLCDINNCAVAQPLAAGTHCTNGSIVKKRRLIRHARRHGVYFHGL